MSARTPIPWWVGRQESGDYLIQSGDPEGFAPPWAVTKDTLGAIRKGPTAQANAEFIVRACNSHDDLLKAALLLHKGVQDLIEEQGWGTREKPLTQAFVAIMGSAALLDAAIAKAEGLVGQ